MLPAPMLARISSYFLQGIDALACEVEVDFDDTVDPDRARTTVVGLPDASVKESIERVRAALTNSGYVFPTARVLINLAPAEVRKEGPIYDLPIAVALLMIQGAVPDASRNGFGRIVTKVTRSRAGMSIRRMRAGDVGGGSAEKHDAPDDGGLGAEFDATVGSDAAASGEPDAAEPIDVRRYLIAGELALDGRVRPIRGVIAMASLAKQLGLAGVIVPSENAAEAAVVPGIEAFGVGTLSELVGLLSGRLTPTPQSPTDVAALLQVANAEVDFADVRGQEAVKRAIVVAAAGSHNLIMLGPAGTGKTMMAKALPGVLPPMSPEEAIEVTRVYSAAGKLNAGQGLVTLRPVRTPHHTSSAVAVIGGGVIPKPGEVSLAHRGVLFMDELAEFPRDVLETLRQPMEDYVVTIARSHSVMKFPANFMLVAAMNPTPKGDMPTDEFGRKQMDRYLSKISGPLIDRVDIHVEAPAVPFKQLAATGGPKGTSSAQMRQQVLTARERQAKRQGAILPNARLSGRQLDKYAALNEECRVVLEQAMVEMKLSARAYDKIRRVSRTIADLAGAEEIGVEHVSEAISYRLLDRRV